jgi:hypothetical protein
MPLVFDVTKDNQTMREHVIEISSDVFHLVQHQIPGYVSWGEEKPGPTQKILVREDVYTEFIDRAIAHRQTLDQVIREACLRTRNHDFSVPVTVNGAGKRSRRRFQ